MKRGAGDRRGSSLAASTRSRLQLRAAYPCANGSGAISSRHEVHARRLPGAGRRCSRRGRQSRGAHSPVTIRVDNTAPGAVAVDRAGGPAGGIRTTSTSPGRTRPKWIARPSQPRTTRSAEVTEVLALRHASRRARSRFGRSRRAGARRMASSRLARGRRQQTTSRRTPPYRSRSGSTRSLPSSPSRRRHRLDPTLVSVAVTDRVSGLASGQIELSRQGTGHLAGLTYPAARRPPRGPNRRFAPACRRLLAARHGMGSSANQNSTDRRRERGADDADAAASRADRSARRHSRSAPFGDQSSDAGSAERSRSGLSSSGHAQTCAYGERVPSSGRLENREGQPVPGCSGAGLCGQRHRPRTARRRRHDRCRRPLLLPDRADASRTLRFAYSGSSVTLPAETAVSLLASAASTIRATSSTTEKRPERPLLRDASRPAGPTRGQARRTPGCALGPLADISYDTDPGGRIMVHPIRASAGPVASCATGSVRNFPPRPDTRFQTGYDQDVRP